MSSIIPLPQSLVEAIWRERTKEQVVTFYRNKKDFESMIRILVYLEDDFIKDTTPKAWYTLQNVLQNSQNIDVFQRVADEMVEETKTNPKLDEAYRDILQDMIGKLGAAGAMIPKKEFADAENANFEILRVSDVIALGVTTILRSIVPYNLLRQIITHRQAILSIDDFVSLVNSSTASLIMVGLSTLFVSAVVIRQLCDWWNGKITGVRCIKMIITSMVSVTAGVVGGMAGGAVGSCAGPVGVFVGGVIGGLWSSSRAIYFIEYMTSKLFGLPKDAALENAYKFFGVDMNASNEEINKIYRAMCLKKHPDKGGSSEDFIEVQLHMGVIKLARGDMN